MSQKYLYGYEPKQKYSETWQRPFLQIPLAPPEYYEQLSEEEQERREEEEGSEEGRRVIIIDL